MPAQFRCGSGTLNGFSVRTPQRWSAGVVGRLQNLLEPRFARLECVRGAGDGGLIATLAGSSKVALQGLDRLFQLRRGALGPSAHPGVGLTPLFLLDIPIRLRDGALPALGSAFIPAWG